MGYSHGEVRNLFERIAHRYDLLNRVLSLGIDQRWRSRIISSCRQFTRARILDVATGTGDVMRAAMDLTPERLVGVDLSRAMLTRVRGKLGGYPYALIEGAAEALPFRDGSFDLVLVAFGVRNFSDRARGLSEIRRVLRPGGGVRILDFSRPEGMFRRVYMPYFQRLLPRVGGLVSGHKDAYAYLPGTVMEFPGAEAFCAELTGAGFTNIRWTHLTAGIVTLHEASVPPDTPEN